MKIIVRIINIIYIENQKINLSFECINKSKKNKCCHKTNEVNMNIDENEFTKIYFNNSIIQFSNINLKEDYINIFIEIDKTKLLNKNDNSNYYFLLEFKDINNDEISLKIENLFYISFNLVRSNYFDDSLIDMTRKDSTFNNDSYLDFNENDQKEFNEEKMRGMQKVNKLVGRLRQVTTLINLKNITLDDYINEEDKKEEKEIRKEDKNDKIKNKDYENNKGLKKINIEKNNDKKEINKFKRLSDYNLINIEDYKPNHRNTNLERKNRMLSLGDKEDYENILSSMNYQAYLEEQKEFKNNKEEQPKRETFCSGFFITSFPPKNASLIEMSENFPASCSHKSCSILKSMKPEILMRYPLEDTDEVEINNMSATICFPTGIKLCHCETELKPEKMKDYLTLLTNRKGDRLYIMTYHFYLRMDKKEFDKKYEIYPLKIKLKELDNKVKKINFEKIDKNTLNVYEEVKICKEFEFRTYIYIPYCLALISKYPYVGQMKQSIYCIFKIIENQIKDNNLELNELLMFLIHSIPIPNINSCIRFPLPYLFQNENFNKKNIITLEAPKFKDINTLNGNICEILKIFKIKNIIRIFRLLLFEKKIIFIDSDYSRLSNVMNSFLSLLYPFQWSHIYIPILSIPMIKYLETFLPFLVGVHSSFIPHIKKILIQNSDEKEQVYLIFIENDKIRISDYFKEESKRLSKSNFLHKNLVNLPIWMYILFQHLLNNIKSKMKKIKKEEASQFNFEIQEAFIEIFVEMFADYNNYIYKVGDESVFNKNLFMSKKSVLEKKFYKEFTETQMFLQFKQDILDEGFEYFKLKVLERNSNYNKEKLGQTTLEKTRTVINQYHQDKKIYLIKPHFINLIKENENNLNNSNYIIYYLKNFENEKFDNSKCKIYLMPTLQTIGIIVKESKLLEKEIDKDKIKNNNPKKNEDKNKRFQIYKIEEQLKEYILKIFKSDDIITNDDEYKNILKILTNEEKGREYFIKLISHNLSKVIILPKNSFDILFHLILEIILIFIIQIETYDDLFKEAVLLVKSTMNYGKEAKKGIITIWDLIKEKLMENTIIYNEKFWNEWYFFEINNNENLNGILLNDVKNNILISISKTMKDLKMDKSVIIYYTNNLMKKHFQKDLDLIDKTKKEILDLFK